MKLKHLVPLALGLVLLGGNSHLAYAQDSATSDSATTDTAATDANSADIATDSVSTDNATDSQPVLQNVDLLNTVIDYTINHEADRDLKKDDYKKIISLIKNGADLDQTGTLPEDFFGAMYGYDQIDKREDGRVVITPLIMVIRDKSTELIDLLLRKGAVVDDRTIRFAHGVGLRHESWDKLLDTYINRRFLKSHKNLNAVIENGMTPLMLVTKLGIDDAIDALIDKGANPNTRGAGGLTPLMIAADAVDINCEIELLNKGADPTIKNVKGETALSIAEDNNANNANWRALDYMRQIARKHKH